MTARETAIVNLLTHHHEHLDPLRQGDGDNSGALLLLPHEDGCRFTVNGRRTQGNCDCVIARALEVERLLAQMRNQAKQKAYGGHSLGKLRFHVVAWYVDVVEHGRWEPKPVVKGKKLKVPSGQQILRDARTGKWVPARYVKQPPKRSRDARKPLADLGVEWMAREWALAVEPDGRPVRQQVAA